MASGDGCEPGGDVTGPGLAERLSAAAADPVQQARHWLAGHGVSLSEHRGPEYGEPEHGGSEGRGLGAGGLVGERDAPADRPGPSAPPDLTRDPVAGRGGSTGRGLSTGRDDGVDGGDLEADPESVARTIVLRKLAAQARTRAELGKALQSKQVPPDAAAAVLDRMETLGLVNDQEFARDWVESRQQRRHLSGTALRRELTAKGVDRDQIDSALESVDPADELRAARSLAAKKRRSMAGLEHQVRYRRLAAMLGRRGFSAAVIAQVAGESVSEPAPDSSGSVIDPGRLDGA